MMLLVDILGEEIIRYFLDIYRDWKATTTTLAITGVIYLFEPEVSANYPSLICRFARSSRYFLVCSPVTTISYRATIIRSLSNNPLQILPLFQTVNRLISGCKGTHLPNILCSVTLITANSKLESATDGSVLEDDFIAAPGYTIVRIYCSWRHERTKNA